MITRKNKIKLSIWDLLICISAGIHAFVNLYNIAGPIADWHAFRQTQTAISIRSYIQNGWSLFYETPIVGKPWMIPMEFPLYQSIVYAVHQVFSGSLEVEARAISLFFFYASLFLIYRLLRIVFSMPERIAKLGIVGILASSYYLFWADAILIENLGLFLAISASLCAYFFLSEQKGALWGILLLFLSTALILSKVTTYVGVFAPFFAIIFFQNSDWKNVLCRSNRRLVFMAIGMLAINYVAIRLWVDACDVIKNENPLARSWTSASLETWNFGTLKQRLSFDIWVHYFKGLGHYNPIFWIASAVMCCWNAWSNKGVWKVNCLLLLVMLSGPLVFFNLYKVHTYYDIPNNWALIILFTYNAIMLCESFRLYRRIRIVLSVLIVSAFVYFGGYRRFVYTGYDAKFIARHENKYEPLESFSESLGPGVVISFANKLSSAYPYHMNRHFIIIPKNASPELMADILTRNSQETLIAVLYDPLDEPVFISMDSLAHDLGLEGFLSLGFDGLSVRY